MRQVRPRQCERDLDDLRLLDRAGDLVRGHDLARAGMNAEVEEATLRWRILHRRRAHADDVITHGPVKRHEQLDVVHVQLRRMPRLHTQIRPAIHIRHLRVILVILQPACAERIVRQIGIVLAFLIKAKRARIRRPGDAGPLAAEA